MSDDTPSPLNNVITIDDERRSLSVSMPRSAWKNGLLEPCTDVATPPAANWEPVSGS